MIGRLDRARQPCLHLLDLRSFITVLATKPRDKVLMNLKNKQNYRMMKAWKDYDRLGSRRLIGRIDTIYTRETTA